MNDTIKNYKMKLFPEPSDVFSSKIDEHREFLLPLATLDLSMINKSWSGDIHFVQPIEPWDGVVGEDTTPHHNYYCRQNWLGYKLVDGRFELLADVLFFQRAYIKANPNFKNTFQGVPSYLETLEKDLEEHYESTNTKYLDIKKTLPW